MQRFLRFQLLLFMVMVLVIASPNLTNAEEPASLNVLLISVDDMNWDSVGALGCKIPQITPHIDQLAREGMLFHKAHVTIAVCQPTRAVWMTGQYPHNNGAYGFETINKKTITLLRMLKNSGYYNAIAGKTVHVVPSRRFLWNKIVTARQLQTGRSSDLFYQHTKELIEEAKQAQKPFFLMINAHDPHRPFAGSKQERQLVKRQKNPNNFPEVTNPYQPDGIIVPGFLPDLPNVRQEIAEYYTSVRRADKTVGAVLRALQESNQAEKTLVIFLSDHGMALPFAKTNCYYHSTRTPLIVRLPGKIQAGSVNKTDFVHGIDLAPTILEALGLPRKQEVDGQSFLALLYGKSLPRRKAMMTVFHKTAAKKKYEMRALHVDNYYYIRNFWHDGRTVFKNESQSGLTMKAMVKAGKNDPAIQQRVTLFKYRVPEELYDYENDPDSLNNLVKSPTHQKRLQQLREELLKQMIKYSDPLKEQFAEELKNR